MSVQREQWRYDDAHHIRAAKGSRRTLCDQEASKLHTLPADTTVWPDANAACWTCWGRRRAVIARPVEKREGLCVGHLPGRKRPAMWIETSVIRPLAYFCGEEEFEEFKRLLGGRGLVQAPHPEEDE